MQSAPSETHERGDQEAGRGGAVGPRALVAYATEHGSTEEVASFIGGVLGRRGLRVDIVPACAAREAVDGYDRVILGGAIYSGRWHRDAHRFLKSHRDELLHVPVAVFGMRPRDTTDEAFARVVSQLARALTRRDWLMPVATAVFGGVDPPSRRPERRRDARDWTVIETWATSVALAGRQAPL